MCHRSLLIHFNYQILDIYPLMTHIFGKERSYCWYFFTCGSWDWTVRDMSLLNKTIYKLKFINTSLKLINKSGTYTRNSFGYVFRLYNLPNLGISGKFPPLLYKGKNCRSLRIPYREVRLYFLMRRMKRVKF